MNSILPTFHTYATISLVAFASLLESPVIVRALDLGNSYKDPATGIAFPLLVGKLTRGEKTDFEKSEPGYGIGIPYRSESLPVAKADIYIYDLKRVGIPSDPKSEVIEKEIKRSADEIELMQKSGDYKEVTLVDSGIATLGEEGAPQARYMKYTFLSGQVPVTSYLLLTGSHSHYFKIRYTFRTDLGEEGERDARRFIGTMGKLLKAAESENQMQLHKTTFTL